MLLSVTITDVDVKQRSNNQKGEPSPNPNRVGALSWGAVAAGNAFMPPLLSRVKLIGFVAVADGST